MPVKSLDEIEGFFMSFLRQKHTENRNYLYNFAC